MALAFSADYTLLHSHFLLSKYSTNILSTMSGCRFSVFCLVGFLCIYICTGNSNMKRCVDIDKQALLKLKDGFIDEFNILLSWRDKVDCCKWRGISCNKLTGHVTRLDLQPSNYSAYLKGRIDYSLCELRHLTFLDLSYNSFKGKKIPKCIGSLGELRELKLADTNLGGSIPHELRNLSNLQTLDLRDNYGMIAYDLEWVSHLSSLRYLSLSEVNLSQAINWELSISKVPSLTELKLSYCDLPQVNPLSSSHLNSSTSLKVLDLHGNNLNTSILSWVLNVSKILTYLDLSANDYLVPNDLEWVSHLSSLRYLNLSYDNLNQVVDWQLSISKLPSLLELKLASSKISGVYPISSLHLNSSTSLKVLDLQKNHFNSSILSWVLNVSKVLRYLDLSYNSLQGQIPDTWTNMTSLEYLDLSFNSLQGQIPDTWTNMISLEYLDLSFNKLEGGIPKSFHSLCKLKKLDLSSNKLSSQLSDSMHQLCSASSSIEVLDLSNNPFNCGPIPEFQKLPSLKSLNLGNTSLCGSLPQSIGPLPHLLELDLSYNNLSGPLPDFTGLQSLEVLDLRKNELNGTLPYTIGLVCRLVQLYLSSNKLNGVISEAEFSNLPNLYILDFSQNLLSFNLSSDWVPPFQLLGLFASGCNNLGPHFPAWLKYQRKINLLDISYSGISDSIPEWFWNLSSSLSYLNLSHNKIHGLLSNSFERLRPQGSYVWDLSFNNISGPLSQFPPRPYVLHLSNNKFSGSLSAFCETSNSQLQSLDLSNNLLSGRVPDCGGLFQYLRTLNLAKNNFTGSIPNSISTLQDIRSIHLNNNNFSGEIPSFMQGNYLELIDLGDNNLHGTLPTWMGYDLPNLIVLRLRANKLQGIIPRSLCNLLRLQILDLSQNNISGKIPYCLDNITALSNINISREIISYSYGQFGFFEEDIDPFFIENSVLMWKGIEMEYGKNLGLMTTIDLSGNHLEGEIPLSITKLLALASLNISGNNLIGSIPNNIGQMKMLESLDLSRNSFCGEIPATISNLNFLSDLNLSFNNLFGKIPTGTQLQSFDASAYMGNKKLCGPPLTVVCPGDEGSPSSKSTNINDIDGEEDEDDFISFGFYVSLGFGFIIGFWAVCGTLILKNSWRLAYFQFVSKINNHLYTQVIAHMTRLKGCLQK